MQVYYKSYSAWEELDETTSIRTIRSRFSILLNHRRCGQDLEVSTVIFKGWGGFKLIFRIRSGVI